MKNNAEHRNDDEKQGVGVSLGFVTLRREILLDEEKSQSFFQKIRRLGAKAKSYFPTAALVTVVGSDDVLRKISELSSVKSVDKVLLPRESCSSP